MVVDYQQHSSGSRTDGVDPAEYHVGRKSKKFWRYILLKVFNIAINNSLIVYKKNNINLHKTYNLLSFKSDLVDDMMTDYSSRLTATKNPMPTTSQHRLISKKLRVCSLCSTNGIKGKGGNAIRTRFACGLCNIPLCKNCFAVYHLN